MQSDGADRRNDDGPLRLFANSFGGTRRYVALKAEPQFNGASAQMQSSQLYRLSLSEGSSPFHISWWSASPSGACGVVVVKTGKPACGMMNDAETDLYIAAGPT